MGVTMLRSIAAAALLASAPAVAGTCVPASCNYVLIKRLYVVQGGPVYIVTDGPQANLDCTLVEGVFMTLDASGAYGQALYALLMTAHLQQLPVTLRINNGSQGCTIAYAILDK